MKKVLISVTLYCSACSSTESIENHSISTSTIEPKVVQSKSVEPKAIDTHRAFNKFKYAFNTAAAGAKVGTIDEPRISKKSDGGDLYDCKPFSGLSFIIMTSSVGEIDNCVVSCDVTNDRELAENMMVTMSILGMCLSGCDGSETLEAVKESIREQGKSYKCGWIYDFKNVLGVNVLSITKN